MESISRLKEKTIYLIVNVLSTQVLIGDTLFTFPVRDGTARFLRDHPSHVKLYSQPSTLSTELMLPRL